MTPWLECDFPGWLFSPSSEPPSLSLVRAFVHPGIHPPYILYHNIYSDAPHYLERAEIEARTLGHITTPPLIPSAIVASTHFMVHDRDPPPLAPAPLLVSCPRSGRRRRGVTAGGT